MAKRLCVLFYCQTDGRDIVKSAKDPSTKCQNRGIMEQMHQPMKSIT